MSRRCAEVACRHVHLKTQGKRQGIRNMCDVEENRRAVRMPCKYLIPCQTKQGRTIGVGRWKNTGWVYYSSDLFCFSRRRIPSGFIFVKARRRPRYLGKSCLRTCMPWLTSGSETRLGRRHDEPRSQATAIAAWWKWLGVRRFWSRWKKRIWVKKSTFMHDTELRHTRILVVSRLHLKGVQGRVRSWFYSPAVGLMLEGRDSPKAC
jgi:hypothetical protein